jgi:hypothetical protein
MGVSRGGPGGLLPPPCRPRQAAAQPPKIVWFKTFFWRKIVSFSLFFRQKIGSCPPPGNFLPSPGKKTADAHDHHGSTSINYTLCRIGIYDVTITTKIDVDPKKELNLLGKGQRERTRSSIVSKANFDRPR